MQLAQKSDLQEMAEQEGSQAFLDGACESDCPFPKGGGFNNRRTWWFNGYFAKRNQSKFSKLFTLQELLA